MQRLLRQQNEVKTVARRKSAVVQHTPETTEVVEAEADKARNTAEEKQLKQAKDQKAQVWGQVYQAGGALVTAVFYAFQMHSLPSTIGAMGGVAFVTHLLYRCLVLQHYFRTGKLIRGGRIGSPLQFYFLPALGFVLMAAVQVPIIIDWSGYESETSWSAGISTVIYLAVALFFVRLAVITLKRRRNVR